MEPIGPFSKDCGGNALIIAAHEIQRAIAMLALTNGVDLLLETDDRNRPRAIIVPRRLLDPLYTPVNVAESGGAAVGAAVGAALSRADHATSSPDPLAIVAKIAWTKTAGRCEHCGPNISGHADTCPIDRAYVLFCGPDRPRFTPDPFDRDVSHARSRMTGRRIAFDRAHRPSPVEPPPPATDT